MLFEEEGGEGQDVGGGGQGGGELGGEGGEELREEGGGLGQCSPNLSFLLWISSSAVHLSQIRCPLPAPWLAFTSRPLSTKSRRCLVFYTDADVRVGLGLTPKTQRRPKIGGILNCVSKSKGVRFSISYIWCISSQLNSLHKSFSRQ